ncbi:LysR family transcriptional regulator (plasmid) [Rhizobium sp. SL42]|nr:LysR family transcriptional regulator [Rhizobium sp. SL42]
MDIATLMTVHQVLVAGGVRKAAARLERPVSSVSAALGRFQAAVATPMFATSGSRNLLTLEGRRLEASLSRAAELSLAIAGLGREPTGPASVEDAPPPALTASLPFLVVATRLSISLATLQRFLIIARAGSIRRAAMEIGMGQPQLTRQMRRLETELAVELMKRGQAGVVLTDVGRRLLALTEDLDQVWSRLNEGSEDRFHRLGATTRLGAVSPLGSGSRVARIIAALVAAWPKRRARAPLFVTSASADELLAGLNAGVYDLVLVDCDEIPDGLTAQPVWQSGLALVGPAGSLAGRTLADMPEILAARRIAAPSSRTGLRQKITQLIDRELPREQRDRLSVTEIDMIPVIANLVVDHGYLTVMPVSALAGLEGEMDAIPLPDLYDIRLTLVRRPSPAADAAMAVALDILRELPLESDCKSSDQSAKKPSKTGSGASATSRDSVPGAARSSSRASTSEDRGLSER